MNKHEFFMRKVLELAEKGRLTTSPNPMVGALVVKKGKIIASAYHARPGGLHAEAIALRKAGRDAKGATLYVNLEPCVHVGRTPPCVKAIIKSGIREVYFSIIDPNPLNNGKGKRELEKNGISVKVGVLNKEASGLNEVFIKYATKSMPFVTIKAAESLDGKIATKTRDSKWITTDASRDYSHGLRSGMDAVLVGVNTIIRDNPVLTSRRNRSPIKIVLDSNLRAPEDANIFSKKSPALNIVAILRKSLNDPRIFKKVEKFNKKGILVIACPGRNNRIDLAWLLKELAELEISRLLVEGGGDTISGFLEQGLADKVLFFIAPKIIGGRGAVTSVEGKGVDKVSQAIKLRDVRVEMIGEDILVSANVRN
ncbi:MAG: bifunctional diaminohydroxyphosphoribosylaminopyrimidine deaminase/5-amino-6-(5-phosphoribosylamino)uracil reductase RibD [Candidatus Omnitrophota bacterium]|nr:bifunctional diaminohydroxyphosphoribosylaminopyrimidine deaminase/5-amino-6-(5-phosphoribosylamino)uracil reductase RibD [Candidatus Omnitrophota bacterium]